MKKMLFIVNPRAGKGMIKNKILPIAEQFTQAGYLVTLYPTGAPLDAKKIVMKQGKKYDVIVCSGGDGTLDEVAAGMQLGQVERPVGYIPCGTTNDYARSVGLPRDPMKAAQVIVNGHVGGLDLGAFDDKFFVYVAAFGAFTDVSYSTSQNKKNALGHFAYIVDGMMSLPNLQSYHMNISCDGEELEGDYIYGMVTNSLSVGGFKSVVRKVAVLDDGVFEVLLVKTPKNPMELQTIVSALLRGDFSSEFVQLLKAEHIVFRSEAPIPWALDGEFGGDHMEADIVNHQGALQLFLKK
ncbi:diacylglycerol/lipid kinase family protein [Anaerolentibacter hominis]|uniref:diacylglycerol/lipid kinase family protein n=1 Tax=Anaerolentibacter hominis TaxID=3079009 RepID=UPI0031B85621